MNVLKINTTVWATFSFSSSEKHSIKCPTYSTLQVGKNSSSNSNLEKDNNQMLVQRRTQEIVFIWRDAGHIGRPKQRNDDHTGGLKQPLGNFTSVQIIIFV